MFVLAHLSDPHLRPLPQASFSELLGKRATGYFNWLAFRGARHRSDVLERMVGDVQAQAPDHIAVTGDLANLSLPGEFAPGRAFLERLGPADRVTVVPGNHDAYVRAEAPTHRSAWRDYLRGDEADEPAFPFVRWRGSLALIGLSTAVPTLPLSSAGRLGREQLEALAATLATLQATNLFRVVLIHHPPAGRRAWHKRLIDAAAFRKVIAKHGAEMILHGHDHRATLHEIAGPGGPVPVIGVPSASAAPDDPRGGGGYNLYRISGRPGAWEVEMERRGIYADGSQIVPMERRSLRVANATSNSTMAKSSARLSAARTAAR